MQSRLVEYHGYLVGGIKLVFMSIPFPNRPQLICLVFRAEQTAGMKQCRWHSQPPAGMTISSMARAATFEASDLLEMRCRGMRCMLFQKMFASSLCNFFDAVKPWYPQGANGHDL